MAYLGETLRQAQGDTLGPTFGAKHLDGGRLTPALSAAEGMGVLDNPAELS